MDMSSTMSRTENCLRLSSPGCARCPVETNRKRPTSTRASEIVTPSWSALPVDQHVVDLDLSRKPEKVTLPEDGSDPQCLPAYYENRPRTLRSKSSILSRSGLMEAVMRSISVVMSSALQPDIRSNEA